MKCTMAGKGVCETCENTDKTGLTFRGGYYTMKKEQNQKAAQSVCGSKAAFALTGWRF